MMNVGEITRLIVAFDFAPIINLYRWGDFS